MKNQILFICLFFLGIIFFACQTDSKTTVSTNADTDADTTMVEEKATMTHEDSVKRGEYMVTIMGCNDCHTPKIMTDQGPVPDPARVLSGHPANEALPKVKDRSILAPGNYYLASSGLTAWVGPWGTSFSANLTPHESGTGTWTLENFNLAIRHGKFKGLPNGRTLLPPMPWQEFKHLTDEDLSNIWAYLKSLPPIDNTVPAAIPPG